MKGGELEVVASHRNLYRHAEKNQKLIGQIPKIDTASMRKHRVDDNDVIAFGWHFGEAQPIRRLIAQCVMVSKTTSRGLPSSTGYSTPYLSNTSLR